MQEDRFAVRVGDVGIGAADAELRDDGVPVAVGVVHEQARVVRVVRVERETEQPTFAPAGDPSRDVDERSLAQRAVLDDPDASALLDDEQASTIVAGVGHVERRDQALHGDFDIDVHPGRVERSRRAGRGGRSGCRWSGGRAGARVRRGGRRAGRSCARRRRRCGRPAGGRNEYGAEEQDGRSRAVHPRMLAGFGRSGPPPRGRWYAGWREGE